MNSGTSLEVFDVAGAALSEGGGGGGCGVDGCVCSSSRAMAEDESNRRGVPLALGNWRTHRRHVVNCRKDGVTDAMAVVAAARGSWVVAGGAGDA